MGISWGDNLISNSFRLLLVIPPGVVSLLLPARAPIATNLWIAKLPRETCVDSLHGGHKSVANEFDAECRGLDFSPQMAFYDSHTFIALHSIVLSYILVHLHIYNTLHHITSHTHT